MKKIIIAALALATAGFSSWSPSEPVNQISSLRGCGTDAGKAAAAISTPSFTGSGTKQFIIGKTEVIYNDVIELAQQSAITGKNVLIDYLPGSANFVTFNYLTSNSSNTTTCQPGSFYGILSFSFRRQ